MFALIVGAFAVLVLATPTAATPVLVKLEFNAQNFKLLDGVTRVVDQGPVMGSFDFIFDFEDFPVSPVQTELTGLNLSFGNQVYDPAQVFFLTPVVTGAFNTIDFGVVQSADDSVTVVQRGGVIADFRLSLGNFGAPRNLRLHQFLFFAPARDDFLTTNEVTFSFTTSALVPEPLSWAMMIVGFGLSGTILRIVRAGQDRAIH